MTAPSYPVSAGDEASPPDYKVWAIVSIVLFWPVGLFAILKSGEVGQLWRQGYRDRAREASRTTKTLCLAGTLAGAFCLILTVGFVIWWFYLMDQILKIPADMLNTTTRNGY